MAQPFDSMNIRQATRQYETWLATHLRVVRSDLDAKHQLMAQDAFSFLRATFYRWMQLFPALCPKPAGAPMLLAVGDLHVENYGTWRDAEGRLVWGINDFDEAFPLPYTIDLVRLATSAWLAIKLGHLSVAPADACAAILAGYTKGLADGGEPFVLAEKRALLREAVTSRERDPVLFWKKFSALPAIKPVPTKVRLLLERAMPERELAFRVAHRRAGLGSLGRQRFTAIADWCGGKIAREAKALLPSACAWAAGSSNHEIYYSQIISTAVRTPDPFLAVQGGCDGCHPLAAGLSCRNCRGVMTAKKCCAPWDGNWPMSIWARAGRCRRCDGIWHNGNQNGCARPPRSWCRPHSKSGTNGASESPDDSKLHPIL